MGLPSAVRNRIRLSILAAAVAGGSGLWMFFNSLSLTCGDATGWWAQVCSQGTASLWTAASGVVAAPVLLLTWYWRTILQNRSQGVQEGNHTVAQSSLENERFARAILLLAGEIVHSRLGGIYALEHLAHEKDHYLPTVVETLAGFLRDHSSKDLSAGDFRAENPFVHTVVQRPETDIQAAITVISSIMSDEFVEDALKKDSPVDLNLRYVQLEGAYLRGGNLSGFRLRGANLRGANLTDAVFVRSSFRERSSVAIPRIGEHPHGAILDGAMCPRANFTKADFRGALMRRTDLRGAKFCGADMTRVNLSDATTAQKNNSAISIDEPPLFGACFDGARLVGSNFTGACLHGVTMHGADLHEATFTKADLSDADLSGARGLTQDQLDGVCTLFCV